MLRAKRFKLDDKVEVRISGAFLSKLRGQAKKRKISLSAMIRECLYDMYESESVKGVQRRKLDV